MGGKKGGRESQNKGGKEEIPPPRPDRDHSITPDFTSIGLCRTGDEARKKVEIFLYGVTEKFGRGEGRKVFGGILLRILPKETGEGGRSTPKRNKLTCPGRTKGRRDHVASTPRKESTIRSGKRGRARLLKAN